MQKENFIPFRDFDRKCEAQRFIDKLEKNGIIYEFEEYSKNTNPLVFNSLEKEILVKLPQEDFEKANDLVLEDEDEKGLDANYYLYNFTDEGIDRNFGKT